LTTSVYHGSLNGAMWPSYRHLAFSVAIYIRTHNTDRALRTIKIPYELGQSIKTTEN